jgi:alpha-tubulin suppressor-like RCC1 family protein
VAWGNNDYKQCNVPSPNSGFVAIAGGMYHSVGLKANGSIVAWGDNWIGQCDVPTPNKEFSAISAAGNNSMGLNTTTPF